MKGLFFLLSFLALLSCTGAKNSMKIVNHCPYDIWFWTVGPKDSNIDYSDGSRTKVAGNNGYVRLGMFTNKELSAGISLKIRDFPYYQVSPAGIVQVEYYVEDNDSLWYDLSVIDCDPDIGPEDPSYCPLIAGGIRLHIPGADEKHCPPASCYNRSCKNAYQKAGPFLTEPSLRCNHGVEVIIETCTERAGPRTFQDHPVPMVPPKAPIPSTIQGFKAKGGNGTRTAIDTQTASMNQKISSTQASSSPEKILEISPNAYCGEPTGFTCTGSDWGDCCSEWGYCGSSENYCQDGCQPLFGNCSNTG